MRGATISLLGIYEYDPSVLDGLQIPSGMDRNILIPDLLAECAEFEILYPEPNTLKTIISSWSGHLLPVWSRMYEVTKLAYNPIENYDRIEDWTDTGSGGTTVTRSSTVDETTSGNDSTTVEETTSGSHSLDVTDNHYSAGYNPNNLGTPPGMVEQTRDVRDEDGTTSGSRDTSTTVEQSGSRGIEESGSSSENSHGSTLHSGRIHGNIGVTTSQQMVTQELDLAHKLDIYHVIIQDFKKRFCIPLY